MWGRVGVECGWGWAGWALGWHPRVCGLAEKEGGWLNVGSEERVTG